MYRRRLGLIGFGSIARHVATRAAALGMEVCAYDPHVPADDPVWSSVSSSTLEGVSSDCDVVSIHVPLNEQTRNLIDADFIQSMRAGAILINTSRGGIIEEGALIRALREGRIGGAALDVFDCEPLDDTTGPVFAGVPNLVLTPHIAGITKEANERVSRVTAENVRRHLI